ncbi:MAG: hypothetical protein A3H45_10435 [Ignavibacteria bacterium RIFCSPLOWO2_02_FULL_55_14]|nr:MAG: hypothetical protein A2X68_10385 [Ignavibacteria bacterium GWC2_56_12]OGU71819.1 MAG: hypothetical protein A3H45_10435 [Ignavibacteria bacterium RIFCSPLOWO2_02_FULL_55_14]OGU76988.1 MAG: hypothetical protein A3G43_10520 [Ignavibacteria bacterium RIFCSPLOWO2_12_FULL_56_21]
MFSEFSVMFFPKSVTGFALMAGILTTFRKGEGIHSTGRSRIAEDSQNLETAGLCYSQSLSTLTPRHLSQ